jgi:pyrroloquinoline quinone biosynthesis protein B
MIKNFPLVICFIFLNFRSLAQEPFVLVLGIAQDGGFPQANCQKKCCKSVWANKKARQFVNSIVLVDPISKEKCNSKKFLPK